MNNTKQELWEERVESFLASGLSRRAWCLEHKIPEHQLGYWVRKLNAKPFELESKRWVGIPTASDADTGIHLKIGEVTLTVKPGFDHQLLADLIRTLTTVC